MASCGDEGPLDGRMAGRTLNATPDPREREDGNISLGVNRGTLIRRSAAHQAASDAPAGAWPPSSGAV